MVVLVATLVASFDTAAISWLYYADRVFQLPLSFIGVGMGVVLLPALATGAGAGPRELADGLNRALEGALALALPASVALMAIATPIVAVLFENGAFGPADTQGTAGVLVGLGAALPGAVIGKVLSLGFFARGEARVPFLAGFLAVAVTLGAALILRPISGAAGIAGAVALGLWVHGLSLGLALVEAGHWRPDRALLRRCPRLVLAALVMGLAVHVLAVHVLASLCADGLAADTSRMISVPMLGAVSIAGVAIYGAAAMLLRAVSPRELRQIVRSI